ncbi:hypothetical protein [Thioclava sp. GXIMD4215]|uniref:hypothetical protein n=1 Tax=Thioclava sp. GXIMD4215 TaxID=3131928 RepID=UPI0032506B90
MRVAHLGAICGIGGIAACQSDPPVTPDTGGTAPAAHCGADSFADRAFADRAKTPPARGTVIP